MDRGSAGTLEPCRHHRPTRSVADPVPSHVDADAFTDRTDFPLTVVTTVAPDGERSGCLAGFTTQCSIDPLRFLVCVSRVNHTFAVVGASEVAGAAPPRREQTAAPPSSASRAVTRSTSSPPSPGTRAPGASRCSTACAAWLALEILDRVDVGDHVALLTSPVGGGPGPAGGLLTMATAPPLDAGHPA